MKTNEVIFQEIKLAGMITKSNLQLLKNRSNKAGKDLFLYELLDEMNGGYGIPLTPEQGSQGLAWLRKFIRRDGTSRVFGYREIEIINSASPEDFVFLGFYDAGRFYHDFIPTYGVNGMEYVPLAEPYVVG